MRGIEQLRKFLMNWVFAPQMIRILCYCLSRCVRVRPYLKSYEKSSRRVYILGNGPSLKKDLSVYREEMMSCDRVAVNFMGITPEFKDIKPTCYVLADSVFFMSPDDLTPSNREKVMALQNILVNETSWPMTLVTLGDQSNSCLIRSVRRNANIKIISTFNGVPLPMDITDFAGWSENRYSPPAQNVINMALYLGVVWRYPEIVLLGADTSFHAMVHVDQSDNRLYIEDEHFYGVERKYMYQDPEGKIPNTMSHFLFHVRHAFLWYEKIREFADWAGVRIVNASSFSWIDAFERPGKGECGSGS